VAVEAGHAGFMRGMGEAGGGEELIAQTHRLDSVSKAAIGGRGDHMTPKTGPPGSEEPMDPP
jgi:hypothetical protein